MQTFTLKIRLVACNKGLYIHRREEAMELSTAELIIDMKRMYLDGAGDDQLCSRGTEIYERIEKDFALARNDQRKIGIITVEQKAFKKLIDHIRDVRHAHALDAYDAFVERRIASGKKK